MALHLITGYAGREHITSADQGSYNAATFGNGDYVFDTGKKFKYTILSNNSIRIEDGEAMMQGRFIKMPAGTTEDVTIENGTQGMRRYDLIVIRYEKDASTSVESTELIVIKGTASASTPIVPTHNHGDINNDGAIINDMPLYRVSLNGLNIESVTALYTLQKSMSNFMSNYEIVPATASSLGGVMVGDGLQVNNAGRISLPSITSGGYVGETTDVHPTQGGSFTTPYLYVDATGRVSQKGTRRVWLPKSTGIVSASFTNIPLKNRLSIPTKIGGTNQIRIEDIPFLTDLNDTFSEILDIKVDKILTGTSSAAVEMAITSFIYNRLNSLYIHGVTYSHNTASVSIDGMNVTVIGIAAN